MQNVDANEVKINRYIQENQIEDPDKYWSY